MQDHVVDAGQLRRRDDLVSVHLAEARDVLGDGAVEQLDVLGQVAQPRADGFGWPLADLGAIQANRALLGGPNADHGPGQGGLARSARANDRQHLTLGQADGHAVDHRFLHARWGDHQAIDAQGPARWRQRHAWRGLGELGQQAVQAFITALGVAQLLPRADQRFGRRHGPAEQDRHGDHHPGGNLVLDHQDGAQAKGQGLPGHAHEARQRGDPRAAVTGFALGVDDPLLQVEPAPAQRREHAHGLDHFGILQGAVDVAGRQHGHAVGFAHALARGQLVPDCQGGQDQ
ncbi:hypothetical protein D3C76_786900 [compost metagenome]